MLSHSSQYVMTLISSFNLCHPDWQIFNQRQQVKVVGQKKSYRFEFGKNLSKIEKKNRWSRQQLSENSD